MIHVEACPLALIGGDIWQAMELAGLWRKGIPPAAGGALDQSAWFVEAAQLAWLCEGFWKAKKRNRQG